MIDFTIEVGKAYVKTKGTRTMLVKIIGEAEPGTYEYVENKKVFYDDRGMFFTQKGVEIKYYKPGDVPPKARWKITREATSLDIGKGFFEVLVYSKEQCSDTSKFIPVDDPNFRMKLGSLYVDRRGLLKLVNKIYHSNIEEDTLIFSSQDDAAWNKLGRASPKAEMMKDIAFQVIRL